MVRMRARHVSGPRHIDRAADDLLAITVVRNGVGFIEPFLAHHRQLGIRHFVFLDNGSSDGTVDRLRREHDVTVLRCRLRFRDYQTAMRRYLVERFSRDRWNVVVDIDERFEFPGSDRIGLAEFLSYLDDHHYQAAVAQMVDLFPAEPLVAGAPRDDWSDTHRLFDLSTIRRTPYAYLYDQNLRIWMHWGGIRWRVFGTENGLTKAALTRPDGSFTTFVDWHHTRGARVADVTTLLLHYPFAGDFHGKVREATKHLRHGPVAQREYLAYSRVTSTTPVLRFPTETAREYEGPDQLVAAGFLQVSERYTAWLDARSRRRSGDAANEDEHTSHTR